MINDEKFDVMTEVLEKLNSKINTTSDKIYEVRSARYQTALESILELSPSLSGLDYVVSVRNIAKKALGSKAQS